ncbi:alpha/beta hydrolase fold domain-containing protein [Aquisphaera insulae]|uniref:alpha/beta hydrolase fold domain-containing protein n=1 Tax=Aquisphaera insulae TaxID=2712864 RepID=UPI0013EB1B86|nr:alpha/beta hydrolase fold domain-containing protein [Aquisphaera insulae]
MRCRTSLGASLLSIGLLYAPAATAQPPGGAGNGSMFDRLDKNQDGKLTKEEFPEFLRGGFKAVDTNGDGSVSRQEDAAFQKKLLQGGPGAGGFGRLNVSATVKIEKEIAYAGTTDPRQKLDLYLPREPKGTGPLPVVVNIHGGAWMGGDKSMGVDELLPLVASGEYAVASINYRLSGQAIWPAQVHDCKAAIRWVRANAAKYHIDADRIGVIGASAGGHLVAMLGASGKAAGLEGEIGPHKGVSTTIRCVVDEFGPSDLHAMGGSHDAANSPESRLIGATVPENKDRARAASPVTYVTKETPPFLIFHGTKDPVVPFNQSERMAAALRAADVPVLFVHVVGAGHGGFRNPEVGRRVRRFFDRNLRGQDVGTISEEPIPNDSPAAGKS